MTQERGTLRPGGRKKRYALTLEKKPTRLLQTRLDIGDSFAHIGNRIGFIVYFNPELFFQIHQ
ncbi:MAG: hypothetical protein BWX80_03741 [Candidatus Hydrogenedentes bacterium ADurb.Bin101]|nr:MAG: hypothetical protein BWX80_03741 [Candidatus Hydrogenedentes bacterium ADurb.Bin101]